MGDHQDPNLKKEDRLRELVRWYAEQARSARPDPKEVMRHQVKTWGTSRHVAKTLASRLEEEIPEGSPLPDTEEKIHDVADRLLNRSSHWDADFSMNFFVLPPHVKLAAAGEKDRSRRFYRWGDPGDTFEIDGTKFKFTKVFRQKVGDITEEDIRRDGYASLDEFKQMWRDSHPRSMASGVDWNPEQQCWAHEYEIVERKQHAGSNQ